jgi:hypothetical protein
MIYTDMVKKALRIAYDATSNYPTTKALRSILPKMEVL